MFPIDVFFILMVTECNVSFENMDYTVLIQNCKGPQFPVKNCCDALKKFACPHADILNDRTNNCAETMFSYINLYGKYPPGLFANECREGKEGLVCEAEEDSSSTRVHITAAQSSFLVLMAGFLGFYFHLL